MKGCLRASLALMRSLIIYRIRFRTMRNGVRDLLGVLVQQRGDQILGILRQLTPHGWVHLQISLIARVLVRSNTTGPFTPYLNSRSNDLVVVLAIEGQLAAQQ